MGSDILPEEILNLSTPYQVFKLFLPDNFLQEVVQMTQLYSAQKRPNKPITTSKEELQRFIGILLYMSLIRQNSSRRYWSADTRIPQIADVMPVNRFEEFKRFLHFSNNDTMTKNTDKIEPLLNQVLSVTRKILNQKKGQENEEHFSQPTLYQCKLELAKVLCHSGVTSSGIKRGRPSSSPSLEKLKCRRTNGENVPPEEVRRDSLEHWPVHSLKRERCKLPNVPVKAEFFVKNVKCTFVCMTKKIVLNYLIFKHTCKNFSIKL